MQITEVDKGFSIENVVPFFQPVMDLKQNTVWNYECLARLMAHSDKAYLPCDFLYIIERQHLVAELTQTIFQQSASYFRNINMAWSINLNVSDIADLAVHKFLQSQLAAYPNPSRISFEVSAHIAIAAGAKFMAFSRLCQSLGVNIIIDHLEQELADLQLLLQLPVAAIKVSAKLFEEVEQNENVNQLIKGIVSLSEANNIVLIADHIETKRCLQSAKDLGINYAQGFYFSQPKACPS